MARIGQLREPVEIHSATETRDAFGAPSLSWSKQWDDWASIEPLRGDEYVEAGRHSAAVTYRIRIRYRAGIVPSMRVVQGSRIWHIESVLNVFERDHMVDMECREVVEGG